MPDKMLDFTAKAIEGDQELLGYLETRIRLFPMNSHET